MERRGIDRQQCSDVVDGEVGTWPGTGRNGRRVLTLLDEDRGQGSVQTLAHLRDHVRLVFDQDVVVGREGGDDLRQVLLFVVEDENVAVNRGVETSAPDLARLKGRVAVGEDYDPSESTQVGNDVERRREEVALVGERH